MKSLVLVCVFAISALGQSADIKAVQVTPVAGESWLNHLHRTFAETSMGKTGRLGPPTYTGNEGSVEWQLRQVADATKRTVILHVADVYRLN